MGNGQKCPLPIFYLKTGKKSFSVTKIAASPIPGGYTVTLGDPADSNKPALFIYTIATHPSVYRGKSRSFWVVSESRTEEELSKKNYG